MSDQRWLKNLVRIGLPAIVLIFYLTAVSHFAYTPDDTYIYMQFARNFLDGDGIAFNPGEPTYGITSPLWFFLVATGGWMGIDLYTAAKGLDLVFACLSLIVFFGFAFTVIRNLIVALCATLAFSVNIWFVRWAGTGMETSLSVLLLILVVAYGLRNEYFLAIVFAALLSLTRPEAWVLAGLVMADAVINSHNRTRGVKLAGALAVVYAVLLAPWLLYAQLTFGTVVPNTARAKAGFGFNLDDFLWTFGDLAKTLAVSDGIGLVIVLIGVVVLMKRGRFFAEVSTGLPGSDENEEPTSNSEWLQYLFLPLAWIAALPFLYILTGANVVSRYLLMIVPVVIVLAYAVLLRILVIRGWERWRLAASVLLTAVILAQSQWIYHQRVKPSIETFTQGMEECFIPIGKWLNTNTPPDAEVFVPDIGAIGYYANRRICDPAGLVSPQFIPTLRQGYRFDTMIEQGLYTTLCNASYVVRRSYDPTALDRPDLDSLFTKMVFGLGLSDLRTTYYTVYRVIHPDPQELTLHQLP